MAECVDSSALPRMKDSRALDSVGYVRSRWLGLGVYGGLQMD